MKKISKTPTFILFILSISPIIFTEYNPKYFAIINIFIIIFFALWLYSIVKMLLNKERKNLAFNERRFDTILLISLAYSIFLSIYFVITYSSSDVSWVLIIIIPGNFFLGYSYFYLLNYTSRVISSVEVGKLVKFDQYASYFFCLIFFPIGIWWISPKIKSLLERAPELTQ